MSHTHSQQEDDAALNRLLNQHFNAPDEQLQPSSGFTLSVMDAIQQHVTVPPPIPFPWKRAIAGTVAALCAFVAFLISVAGSHSSHPAFAANLAHSSVSLASTTQIALVSVVMAIVLSIGTIVASFRIAGRSR